MVTRKQNLVIDQGSNIHFAFQLYEPSGDELTDSTGYAAQADLRQTLEFNTIYTFDTSVSDGMVNLHMTPAYSATVEPDNYYYTVELAVANTVSRIVEGMAVVRPTYVLTSSNVHDADPVETPLPPVPTSNTMMFEYIFDNIPLPPPSVSQLRFNDFDPHFTTKIWIHNNNADGVDESSNLLTIGANYSVVIQDKNDPLKRIRFNILGPMINMGTYCELSVAWETGIANIPDDTGVIVAFYGGLIP